jgi:hypothetical protein
MACVGDRWSSWESIYGLRLALPPHAMDRPAKATAGATGACGAPFSMRGLSSVPAGARRVRRPSLRHCRANLLNR